MNTKSILGLVVVVGIIVAIGVWLHKAPASPTEPTVATSVVPADIAASTTTTASTPTTAAPTPAPTVKAKVISTKTVHGMKIDVTKEGTGTPIANGQTAQMLYTGTLADGSVFDSTSNHGGQPFEFQLGSGMVIKGWDEGILGMKVGEERTLTIPPELGYGAKGYPPVIPENATLTFTVTLVGIK